MLQQQLNNLMDTETAENQSEGLRAKNLSNISPRFICQWCRVLLLKPYQLSCCGAIICNGCWLLNLCIREPFTCTFCNETKSKAEALPDRAVERELRFIHIECYSCSWNGAYTDYLIHLKETHADKQCENCHEKFFSVNDYQEHCQKLCEQRFVCCGLVGCTKTFKWCDISTHLMSPDHQIQLLSVIVSHRNQQHDKSAVDTDQKEDEQRIKNIAAMIDELGEVANNLLVELNHSKEEIAGVKRSGASNSLKIEQLRQRERTNEDMVQKHNKSLDEMQSLFENLKQMDSTTNIKILDSNSTVTFRFNVALDDKIFSVPPQCSTRFRTSIFGYEWMLWIKSTTQNNTLYLSLFLSLCDTEFNNLLVFPFRHDIHLTLLDQSHKQKHITYVLKPDLESKSFARPTTQMNEEYPINQFCLISDLVNQRNNYVKDGSFFIRLFIDFSQAH